MKTAVLIASLLLSGWTALAQETPQHQAFRVSLKGRIDCSFGKGEPFVNLLPCAWQVAQIEVVYRIPKYAKRIYRLQQPKVELRLGIWHDPEFGDINGKTTDPGEVEVGLMVDNEFNYDTAVHEFKHWITFQLPLNSRRLARLTRWVDNSGYRWRRYCKVWCPRSQ